MSNQVDDFRSVFDATYSKVVAYARRRAEAAVADDVVAETYLVAWRRRDELAAMDNPLPWLYAVAGNQLRNQHRSANRHLRLVSKVAGDATSDPGGSTPATQDGAAFDTDPAVDLVRAALELLSFDDQEVLRLIAWEDLTYQQAAEALGCSIDAVAQRIRRAKQRLAGAVDSLVGDDSATQRTESRTHPRGA